MGNASGITRLRQGVRANSTFDQSNFSIPYPFLVVSPW
jgi:hypothetical protein